MKISIKYLILSLMLLLAVTQGLYIYTYSHYKYSNNVESNAARQMQVVFSQLQSVVHTLVSSGNTEQLQSAISSLSTDPRLRGGAVVDGEGKILAANQFAFLQSSLEAFVEAVSHEDTLTLNQSIARASDSLSSEIWFTADRESVVGVHPFSYSQDSTRLRPGQTGLIFLEYDLQKSKAEALDITIPLVLLQAVMVLAVALLLHLVLTRKLGVVLMAAQAFSAKNYAIRTGMKGRNEIEEIGLAFDRMAEVVEESQKDLQMQAERISTILDTTAEAIFGIDEKGVCNFANNACVQILGFTEAGQLVGRNMFDILQHSDRLGNCYEFNESPVFRTASSASPCSGDDDLFSRQDGSQFYVQYWAHPLHFGHRHRGAVVSFFDTSERVESQRELLIKESAIEASLNGVMMANPDGLITYVNRAFMDMWNIDDRNKLIASAAASFWDYCGERQSLRKALNEQGRYVGEVVASNQNGQQVIAQMAVNMLSENEGSAGLLLATFVDISAQKEVEDALRRSEETYAKAEEIAHIGSWDWNILNGELRWTDEIYRIFGQQPQSFGATYEAFVNTIHPDDRKRVLSAVNDSITDPQKEYSIQHRVIAPSGEQRMVHERGKVYRDDQGKPLRMIGTVHDITERLSYEKQLDEERNFVSAILESANAMVVVLDKKGRIERFNRACEQITGYSFNELKGEYVWSHLLLPEEIEPVKAVFANLKASAMAGEYQNYWLDKQGAQHLIAWSNSVLTSAAGEVEHIIAVGKDITEQTRAEEALNVTENRLQTLMAYMPIVLFALDMKGRFILSEGRGLQSLGLKPGEVVGRSALEMCSGIPEVCADLRRALQGDSFSVIRNIGEQVYETYYSPVFSLTGERSGTLAISIDITERRAAEMELEAYRNRLEELVSSRTAALHSVQDELIKKERLATLGQLTATVSHELRNPLGAMRPSVYLIKKNANLSEEKVVHAIDRLERNIKRCDNIIDELLDFTRIKGLDLQPVILDEWLASTLEEHITVPDGIDLHTHFSLAERQVNMDADRMRRVVINVIDNACQAMVEMPGSLDTAHNLWVSTSCSDQRIQIIVEDDGPGIEDGVLGKIFEPLFSTKGFGVGLGLPTVKQILQQHHGDMEVETVVGKGTRMTMWLPLEN